MKYLLTFKPLGHFFFGNERTFREDYVARSEYFPQPTQVLGALRLTLAQQYGLIKQYRNGRYTKRPRELQALTGTAKADTFMSNDDLGKIGMISPMFIVYRSLEDALFPTPFDVHAQIGYGMGSVMTDTGEIVPVAYPQKVSLSYLTLSHIGPHYYLDGYDAKGHAPQMLGNSAFWKAYMGEEERAINAVFVYEHTSEHKGVFVPHTQVGIALEAKQTIAGKFYAKQDYTLREGFLFACVLELDGEIREDFVQLGAEGSLFRMEVHPLSQTGVADHPVVSALLQPRSGGTKLVAISEMMAEDTAAQPVYFSLIPYLRQRAELKSQKGRFLGVHTVKNTIPAGSVFYPKDGQMLDLVQGAYAKMGYNRYISL